MKSTVFSIGDAQSIFQIPSKNSHCYVIPGMPINDIKLKHQLDFNGKHYDFIFLGCGYPLFGCEAIHQLKKINTRPVNERFLDYKDFDKTRGFYEPRFWTNLKPDDLMFLFSNWTEMIQYYINSIKTNLILVPIAAKYFDDRLGLSLKALPILEAMNTQLLDLSPLDKLGEKAYLSDFGLLSDEVWQLLYPNIYTLIGEQP